MTYDPFSRGPHPVGVSTVDLSDATRSRYLPTEVWYPATAAYAGKDLADDTRDRYDVLPGFPPASQRAVRGAEMEPGRYPLIVFSHGFGGHRRQSTFLCTHLASHGYVVAAMDHSGNTVLDMAQMTMRIMMGQPMPDVHAMMTELIEARPGDVRFVIDRVLAGDAGVAAGSVDEARIGLSGHSFGGWTTLKTTGLDRRIRAALALAPAGGPGPLPADLLVQSLDFAWGRDVPTMLLVADKDTLLPLSGMHHILERASCTKRMIVLENADHMHFCDDVEQTHELFRTMPPPGPLADIARAVPPITDLCPGTHAYEFNSSLGLAHMDANLKGSEEAAGWLSGDLRSVFAERDIRISVI